MPDTSESLFMLLFPHDGRQVRDALLVLGALTDREYDQAVDALSHGEGVAEALRPHNTPGELFARSREFRNLLERAKELGAASRRLVKVS